MRFCLLRRNLRWQENDFLGKSPVVSAVTLWVKNFIEIAIYISQCFRDKYVFVFYAEIQDGHQKWREKDFWENSPVDSLDTLWVKKFVKITLSRTVSEINAFFCVLRRNSRWRQKWQENDFRETSPVDSADTCRSKSSSKLLYLTLFPR